jgi:heme/copper-type cytochrome/quinol oxidase subunit 2
MDLISILTTVILATTIGTVIVGVAAYAAFKLRDKRKPKAKPKNDDGQESKVQEAIFLKPYEPNSPTAAQPAKAAH